MEAGTTAILWGESHGLLERLVWSMLPRARKNRNHTTSIANKSSSSSLSPKETATPVLQTPSPISPTINPLFNTWHRQPTATPRCSSTEKQISNAISSNDHFPRKLDRQKEMQNLIYGRADGVPSFLPAMVVRERRDGKNIQHTGEQNSLGKWLSKYLRLPRAGCNNKRNLHACNRDSTYLDLVRPGKVK
ncbi:hypothetical protein BC567DRAFT_78633 [Phyllosticta citribraziliensis]